MLSEMAVADADAIAFEFVKDPPFKNDLASYKQHPTYDDLKPSQYTDDTQRSIANALVVLSRGFHDPCAFVSTLQRVFREDPRKGYSRRFQQYMEENKFAHPLDWMRGIPQRRESNGSIMGVAPLGYLRTPVDVRLGATFQAITTHSVATAPYAQAIALAAHYLIYALGPKNNNLLEFLRQEVEGWDKAFPDFRYDVRYPPEPVPIGAGPTAFAVLNLVDRHNTLSGIVKEAVDIGGDTDSVAALAVAIASCSKEVENDLPEVLISGLEFGDVTTQSHLKELDRMLKAMTQ